MLKSILLTTVTLSTLLIPSLTAPLTPPRNTHTITHNPAHARHARKGTAAAFKNIVLNCRPGIGNSDGGSPNYYCGKGMSLGYRPDWMTANDCYKYCK